MRGSRRLGGEGFDASTLDYMRAELAAFTVGDEWVDQKRSPLISHCATVTARIEAGLGGARVDGDRYLLTTAALAEEMANGST